MKGQTHGGKGSTPRPTNKRRFDENYEKIFNKTPSEGESQLDEGIHTPEGDGRSGESKFREYAEGQGVQGQADQEQTVKAAAVLPNGELTSNVYDAFDKGYAQAKIDLAEQAVEQNPVAWHYIYNDGITVRETVTQTLPLGTAKHYTVAPLYAHPPKRQPLSAKDILHLETKARISFDTKINACEFARLIEKAHGISDER